MTPDPNPWQRFAAAVRQLEADTTPSKNTALPAGAIPWLQELPGQVQVLWLRMVWRRWALVAILASLAVLGGFFLASQPVATPARVPRIPVPSPP